METSIEINNLLLRIRQLEVENLSLRAQIFPIASGKTVNVLPEIQPVFDKAEQTVGDYFKNLSHDPSKGIIEINDQRCVLVRVPAFSYDTCYRPHCTCMKGR